MSMPPTRFRGRSRALYRARYGKHDAALLEELAERCRGEVTRGVLRATHEGASFRLRFDPQHGLFDLAVGCTLAGRCRFTRKLGIDRWMEHFVPAQPIRSHDPRFDRDVNVQTRDLRLTGDLITRPPIRAAVRRLFETGASSVHLAGERVRVVGRRRALGKQPDAERVLSVVDDLALIARAVDGWAATHELHVAPRFDAPLVASWSLLGLLVVAGVAGLIAGGALFPLVDPAAFVPLVAAVAAAPLLVTVVLLAFAVRRRTAPYGLVRLLALAALLAVPLATAGTLLVANGLLDEGPVQREIDTVRSRTTWEQKGHRHYEAVVAGAWSDGEAHDLEISRETYENLRVGVDAFAVTTSPGALGHRWLVAYERIPAGPEGPGR